MDQTQTDPFSGFWSTIQSAAASLPQAAASVLNNASASQAAAQQQAAANAQSTANTLKIIAIGGLVLAGILIVIAAIKKLM